MNAEASLRLIAIVADVGQRWISGSALMLGRALLLGNALLKWGVFFQVYAPRRNVAFAD